MKSRWTIVLLLISVVGFAQQYKPAPSPLMTRWGKEVAPGKVWNEYPRPQIKRTLWQNLNGLWEYAITTNDAQIPKSFEGEILVPFAVESALSGVGKALLPTQLLWYKRSITIPSEWKNNAILLHFGAVDWESTLYIDGKKVGNHKGGFDAFTFDISAFVKAGKTHELLLRVYDPTDSESQPRGKQVLNPKGIWYTPVSGIWQTVWMEPVNATFVQNLNPIADIDNSTVELNTHLNNSKSNCKLQIVIKDGDAVIVNKTVSYAPAIKLEIPNAKLWSPQNPKLYQLALSLSQNGKVLDEVQSYFAMRKIAKQQDENGYSRIYLNNSPIFMYGTLDQGWWPDGLHTPPSAEAMRWDMEMLQQMGFNTIRKHIKVEPALYYYYADSMGMLVWQDMPSGFTSANQKQEHIRPQMTEDWAAPEEDKLQFKTEMKSMMDALGFFPSIVIWTVFNEGWGQFDTPATVKWAQEYDPTRIIDGVSGWTDRKAGQMYDVHHYTGPGMKPTELIDGRISTLGEFGGLGYPIEGHLWAPDRKNWGYVNYKDPSRLMNDYYTLIYNMIPMVENGLSAAIYTQTTDVEIEVNGLITYDREIVKMPVEFMHKIHQDLYKNKSSKAIVYIKDNETYDIGNVAGTEFDTDADASDGKNTIKEVERTFHIDEIPRMFFMRYFIQGNLKVYINKTLVHSVNRATWRHYNTINLEEYMSVLIKGENTIRVECSFEKDKSQIFDYGLYGFE